MTTPPQAPIPPLTEVDAPSPPQLAATLPRPRKPIDGLFLVALFKLFKTISLLCVAMVAWHWARGGLPAALANFVERHHLDPDTRFTHMALELATNASPARLKALAAGAVIYALLFGTEGVGLLLRKRWAEWMVVITTAALLPIELYETARHPTPGRAVIVALNIVIIAYLVHRVQRDQATLPYGTSMSPSPDGAGRADA